MGRRILSEETFKMPGGATITLRYGESTECPDGWEKLHIATQGGMQPVRRAEVAAVLGLGRASAGRLVAEWVSQGWLIPVRSGRFVLADQGIRTRGEVLAGLAPFSERCFYPTLHLAVGLLLRKYHGTLTAIALFGSTARGEERADSDIDLAVVGTTLTGRYYSPAIASEAAFIEHSFCALEDRLDRLPGHAHPLHVTTLKTEMLDPPESTICAREVLWTVATEGRVLYDPDLQLRATLDRIRWVYALDGAGRQAAGWGKSSLIRPDPIEEYFRTLPKADP